MSQEKRSRLSAAQKTDVWRRWKTGQSLHEIGRVYGKWHNSIRCVLLSRGGSRYRTSESISAVNPHDQPGIAVAVPRNCKARAAVQRFGEMSFATSIS
jgi:hypothetical protein